MSLTRKTVYNVLDWKSKSRVPVSKYYLVPDPGLMLSEYWGASRQLTFTSFRNNQLKIGLNMSANKLHCVSDLVSLDMLNLNFIHFKKLAKIRFLKFGKT